MHIGDTGTQAMHFGEGGAAADSVLAAGRVVARRAGCVTIQQSFEGGGRFDVDENGDIAEGENQRVVGTALECGKTSFGEGEARLRSCQA
jgi:hypothetical protein